MPGHKFAPEGHNHLDRPERLEFQPPARALEALALSPEDTLLDLGAGTGYFLLPAAKTVKRAIGLDISKEMLGKLMSATAAAGATNVDGILITETSIPLPADSADAALCVDVLHEMDEPAVLLGEVRRVLRPGGRLLLVDWEKKKTPHGPPLEHRVDLAYARKAIEDAGFPAAAELAIYEQHFALLAGT